MLIPIGGILSRIYTVFFIIVFVVLSLYFVDAEELFSNATPEDGSTITDTLIPVSIDINSEEVIKESSVKIKINGNIYKLSDNELSWDKKRLTFIPQKEWPYGAVSVHITFDTYMAKNISHSWSFIVDNEDASDKSYISDLGYRMEKNLTSVWKMSKLKTSLQKPDIEGDEGYKNKYWEPGFDTSSWRNRLVSLSWMSDYGQNDGYGIAWYKKKVFIPKGYKGKNIILTFEGMKNQIHLWINGKKAGSEEKLIVQYLPSRFEITDLVTYGEDNDVTICCISSMRKDYTLSTSGGISGIFGEVKMEFSPNVNIKRVLIDPLIDSNSIKVRYEIENCYSKSIVVDLRGIIEPSGEEVVISKKDIRDMLLKPGINDVSVDIKINSPRYWSPDDPYLYRLFSILKQKDEIIDIKKDNFGFREFIAKDKYLYLNKKRFHIFGIKTHGYHLPDNNYYVSWGAVGLDQFEEFMHTKKDFLHSKGRGVNFLRMWPSPGRYIYDVTDELGMINYECFECELSQEKSEQYLNSCVTEIREWILENYNHPSFVMLNFGNENWSNTKQPTYIYERLKPEFKNRVLMCASSGMFGFTGQVREKPGTDIIDMHNYTGSSFAIMGEDHKIPWTYMEDTINGAYEYYKKTVFGGDIDMPLIITEAPYQAWFTYWLGDEKRFLHDGKVTPESYIEITKTPEGPNNFPIGWDLENTSLRDRIGLTKEIETKQVKRSIESQRRIETLQGVGANVTPYIPDIFSLLYKPLFICSSIFPTNLFSGTALNMKLYIINDYQDKKDALLAKIIIKDKDNSIINEDKLDVGDVPGSSRKTIDYSWNIPDTAKTSFYNVRLYLYSNNVLASENYYEIYILNGSDLKRAITTTKKTAMLVLPQNKEGLDAITSIFESLRVSHDKLKIGKDLNSFYKDLKKYDILVIPAFYNNRINNWLELDASIEAIGKSIRRWVEEGGRLISFEQSIKGPLPWVKDWRIMDGGENCFIDMAVPEHPVYNDLKQHNFDTWNDMGGENARYVIRPISENLIATVSANSNDEIVMAIAEARVGKGNVLASQIEATNRYMKDSCATKYIQNLLSYVLEEKVLYPNVRELKEQKEGIYFVDLDKCFYVNLKPYMNMGFKDEIAEDKKGGWSDQGENDLQHIPVGEDNPDKRYWQIVYHQELKDKQVFLGVPFEVVDSEKNNNKSCIVLSGGPRPYFPKEVKGIKVNREASKVYFLHSAVWCPVSGLIGAYIIHYSNGTEEVINLKGGKQITDWWGPKDLDEAKVAWMGKHPVTGQNVGVYLFEWENPNSDRTISSIDFVSSQVAVPILLAITAVE